MADEEFNHRRRKKGQPRQKVSMDEFIKRKREAENIQVETDKPDTPEVQPSSHASPAGSTIFEKPENERPASEESFPDLPLDSQQYMSDTPPPLPTNRRESRPANRKMSTFGQPPSEHPGLGYRTPRQNAVQQRASHVVSRQESVDQGRPNHKGQRQSYAVPRQNTTPVRHSNNRKSVMSNSEPMYLEKYVEENDWQDGKTLAETNLYMLVNEIDCDVTCIVGSEEEVVAAHSYVLMSRSFLFSNLLSEQMKHLDKVLVIPDVDPEPFRHLLRYFYTNDLALTVQGAIALLPTCAKYGNKSLKQRCFKYLLTEMSSENVCVILELAHEFDEPTIHDKCLHFIHVNANDTLNANGFRNLCRECVEKIVDSNDLFADEMAVFNALVTWADSECMRRKVRPTDETRREVLGNLLYCVRYSTMNVHDFTHKVSHNKIITAEEKIMLYQYFHGKLQGLPQHFQKGNRRQRTVRPEFVNKMHYRRSESNSPMSQYELGKNNYPWTNESPRNKGHLRVIRFKGISGTLRNIGPDAIAFRCSEPIGMLGIQIFGPPEGTNFVDVSVAILDDQKKVVRNQDFTVTTEASKVCDVILKDPILVPAWKTFTIKTTILGVPSTRGTDGAKFITAEGVKFEFMASSESVNGTDETAGQIPSILFTKL